MSNLRNLAVSDAKTLNENDWGMPIELVDPDGTTYNLDNVTGESLKAVQILYDYRKFNPDSGMDVLVTEPVVVISRAALARIPAADDGEWSIRFPIDPDPDIVKANWGNFIFNGVRSNEGGRSLGLIRIYPTKAVQTP